MRNIDIKLYVLRNNVPYTQLECVSAPTIRANADGEIKSSLSVSVIENNEVNWLTDELNPVLVIDGIEHSYGIFAPTTYSVRNDGVFKTVDIEAYDRCWWLKVKRTDSIKHIPAGANYVEVIKALLVECGVALVNAIPSSLVLATSREDWEISTEYITIINTLLEEISYNPIWFDGRGFAVVEPKQQLNGNIARHYNFNNIKSLCREAVRTMDFFNAPNVFLCVCSNPDHSVWIAKSKNDNPTSPLSVPRRGREIIQYVKVDNIASQEELQIYADNLAFQSMLLSQKVELTTGMLTNVGFNDVVSIVHPDFHGIAREKEWTITLEPNGEMSHILEASTLAVVADQEEESEEKPIPPTPPVPPTPTEGTIAGIAIVGINIVGVV